MTAQMVLKEGFRGVQSVNTGNGGDNHAIWTGNKRSHGRKTLLFNPFVDAQFFVNVQIPLGEVSLGLVIVVMRHKIFHRVLWEIPDHFLVQLASERLVMAHDEGGDVELLDDVRHGKGLAAPGHPEQNASFLPFFQLRNQFFNCFWLVASRFKLGV